MISTAGDRWSPLLVFWGTRGRGNVGELLGYYPSGNAKRGPIPEPQRAKRIINLWDVSCVYSLFHGEDLLYVGEGVLGNRLFEHYYNDAFAGRWDSFSWLSPMSIDTASDTHTVTAFSPLTVETAKDVIKMLELVTITLTEPAGNRQSPRNDGQIKWMRQVRSQKASATIEEKLDKIIGMLSKG